MNEKLKEAIDGVFRTGADGKLPQWLYGAEGPSQAILDLPEMKELLEDCRLLWEHATGFVFYHSNGTDKVVVTKWEKGGWGVCDRFDPEAAYWWTTLGWVDGGPLQVEQCYPWTRDEAVQAAQQLARLGLTRNS
jgi:hypothetical protein